jgi:glycosyltransferase involved in cell wall biosynthesis
VKVLSINNLNMGYSATLADRHLFAGLIARGVELTVITHSETEESKSLEEYGIKVIYFPIRKKIDIKAIVKLRTLLKTQKFDIIHLTYSKAITNGLIASHGLDVKVTAYLGSLSLYWHDPTAYLSFLNRRIDKLICLSKGVEKHVLKQSFRRMEGKTAHVYKGYDPSWFGNVRPAARATFNIPDDGFLICCIANVRKIKGIPYLIASSGLIPEGLPLYFMLIGPGMDSSSLNKLIDKSPYKDNFRTLGFTEDVLSCTSMCDLYIQPSVTEGLGRSVIEAMCLGKPVIVSGKGGVEELILEGENGFFVPSRSPDSIAEKILFCYENRNLLPEMGKKAKDRILSDFNPRAMIDQTYKVFHDLTEE